MVVRIAVMVDILYRGKCAVIGAYPFIGVYPHGPLGYTRITRRLLKWTSEKLPHERTGAKMRALIL